MSHNFAHFLLGMLLLLTGSVQALELAEISRDTPLTTVGGRSPGRHERERVKAGTKVLVIYRNQDYAGVCTLNGKEGEILRKNLRMLPSSVAGIARVEDPDGWVYLRSGPSKDSKPIAKIGIPKHNPRFVFLLSRGEWLRVLTEHGEGYINQSRLHEAPLDSTDDADKRALVDEEFRRRKKDAKGQVVVYCGFDRYYYNTETGECQHLKDDNGLSTGRWNDWALLWSNELDGQGNWIYFGGVPTHLYQRVDGKWKLRGSLQDQAVDRRELQVVDGEIQQTDGELSLPQGLIQAFGLYYSPSP